MLSPGELVRRSGLGDGDGVVRIVDAMRLHSRSMDILDRSVFHSPCRNHGLPSTATAPIISRPRPLNGRDGTSLAHSGCNAIWCLAKAEPGLKGQIRRTDAVQVNARLANSCTPRGLTAALKRGVQLHSKGLTAALKGLTAARRTPHCQQL